MIVVSPPADLSLLVMKTLKMLIEIESESARNLGWKKTAIRFHKYKFVDDSIDSIIL